MDISFTKEQEDFREKAKTWLKKTVPLVQVVDSSINSFENYVNNKKNWEKLLFEGGFAGLTWPKKYGGQGKDDLKQIIFKEECGKMDAPAGLNVIGSNILGPTLLEIGTEEQKERFIPKILSGDEIWCQGFSEPNAGSDLASLSTRAELSDDKWVINGQKTWVSWAQYSQYCILLARTNPDERKHKGITFFLVPMDLDGITVRPLIQMNGEKEFSEIFFDDVHLNKDMILGEVDGGWGVAMRALSFERGTNPLEKQARFHRELMDLIELSEDESNTSGRDILNNAFFQQKLAKAYSELEIMRYLGLQIVDKLMKGKKISDDASLQKLYWSEYHKRFGELSMKVLGEDGVFWQESGAMNGKFQNIFFHSKAETIFAGTSEIQKNIIAERILGMPR